MVRWVGGTGATGNRWTRITTTTRTSLPNWAATSLDVVALAADLSLPFPPALRLVEAKWQKSGNSKELHQYSLLGIQQYRDINVAKQSGSNGDDFLLDIHCSATHSTEFYFFCFLFFGTHLALGSGCLQNPSKSQPTFEAINLWLIPNLINSSAFGMLLALILIFF